MTFGFNDAANLDEGAMWPTSFALTDLTAVERREDRLPWSRRPWVDVTQRLSCPDMKAKACRSQTEV